MFVRKKTYNELEKQYNELLEEYHYLSEDMEKQKEDNKTLKERLEDKEYKLDNLFNLEEEDSDKVLFEINSEEEEITPKVSIRQDTIEWLMENNYIDPSQSDDQTAQTLAMLLIVYNSLSEMMESIHMSNQ